jgi:hypothetical protein
MMSCWWCWAAASVCAEIACWTCLPSWRPGTFLDPWWWSFYAAFRGLFGLVHHGDDDDDRKRRRRRREQRAEDLPLVAPAMTATRVNT